MTPVPPRRITLANAKLLHYQGLLEECANYCLDAINNKDKTTSRLDLIFLHFYAAMSYDQLATRTFEYAQKLELFDLARQHYSSAAATATSYTTTSSIPVRTKQVATNHDSRSKDSTSTARLRTPSLCSDGGTSPESTSPPPTANLPTRPLPSESLSRYVTPHAKYRSQGSYVGEYRMSWNSPTKVNILSARLKADYAALARLMAKHAEYMQRAKNEAMAAQKKLIVAQNKTLESEMKEMSKQVRIMKGRSRGWRSLRYDPQKTQDLANVALAEL